MYYYVLKIRLYTFKYLRKSYALFVLCKLILFIKYIAARDFKQIWAVDHISFY